MAMPKIEHLVKNVEDVGNTLGEKSSLLSDILQSIEDRLNAVSGKVEAVSNLDNQSVSYIKGFDGWGIYVETHDEETGEPYTGRLIRESVETKARAFPTVLDLLGIIEKTQLARLKVVEKALATLKIHDLFGKSSEGK